MTLLDIIIDPTFPDTSRSVPEPVVPDTVLPADTTDTVAKVINMLGDNQQIADIAPRPSGILEMAGGDLLWTMIVVLAALSLCFYFVKKYRRTKTS